MNERQIIEPTAPEGQHRVCIIAPESHNYQEHMVDAKEQLVQEGIKVDEIRFESLAALFKNDLSVYCSAIIPDVGVARHVSREKPELHIICIGDMHPYSFRGDVVTYNYYSASNQATRYLINLGYRKIALYNLAGKLAKVDQLHMEVNNIEDGYRDAIQMQDLDYFEIYHYKPGRDNQDVLAEMLRASYRPEAVVCTFDHRAFELYEYAKSINLKIPEDLALMTLGSSTYAEKHKFSSVDFCPSVVAPLCVDIIKKIIDKRRFKRVREHHLIDTELIIRESCGYKLKQ